ncbi:MAG: phage portal protein [Planctomycetes bacterium]|nr:phage portal protein [Planctomycetota bacterium]
MPDNNSNVMFYDGSRKAINIENLPPEAWKILSGGSRDNSELEILRKVVPWLYAGVEERAGAQKNMPFVILDDRGEEFDTSENYQNKLGWWPDPFIQLWLIEACLTLPGRAYFFKQRSKSGTMLGLQYMLPNSIDPKIDQELGLQKFIRRIPGRTDQDLDLDEVVYFWGPDETVEIGPPTQSKGIASMGAAGVTMNVDQFAALFFKRGAIKATLYSTPRTTSPEERGRLRNWLDGFLGSNNAWRTMVLNADQVTAETIGEGIQELANTELTTEKREEIAVSLGVPMSLLWGKSANRATARIDAKKFHERMVQANKPIATVLNQQLFNPLGFTIEFRPEKLEISQEEEVQRSGAQVNLTRANWPPWIAAQTTGYDLPEGMTWEEFRLEVMAWMEFKSSLRPEPGGGFGQDEGGAVQVGDDDSDADKSVILVDPKQARTLAAWENHAIKSFRTKQPIKGTENAAAFDVHGNVPALMVAAIGSALGRVTSIKSIQSVFANVDEWREYP